MLVYQFYLILGNLSQSRNSTGIRVLGSETTPPVSTGGGDILSGTGSARLQKSSGGSKKPSASAKRQKNAKPSKKAKKKKKKVSSSSSSDGSESSSSDSDSDSSSSSSSQDSSKASSSSESESGNDKTKKGGKKECKRKRKNDAIWERLKDIWALEERPDHMKKRSGVRDMSLTEIIRYKEHFEKEAEKRGAGAAIFGKDKKLKVKKYKAQKDNGADKLHPARWERLPTVEPRKYWRKVPKRRENVYRHLHLGHYGAEGLVNEVTLVRLHDRYRYRTME